MALRQRPLPWAGQPQEAFALAPGVDYATTGLLSSGALLGVVGSPLPTAVITDRGIAWSFIGTSGSYVGGTQDVADLFSSTGNATVHILARRKSTTYAFSMVGRGDATNKGWSIGWAGSSGGSVLYGTVTHGTTDCKVTTTAAAAAGAWQLITMRLTGAPTVAGALQLFINGAPAGGTSTAGAGLHPTDSAVPLRIGSAAYGGFSGFANAFEGEIALFAAHRYAQSDAEIAAVAADPWQLLEPQRLFVPVAAAAGSITGSSAQTISLSGSSAGTVAIAGASSGTLTLAGSAAATVAVAGASSQTVALTGTAAGVVPIGAASAATLALLSLSTGQISVAGASAGTLTLSGTATGTTTGAVSGASDQALPISGTAAGTVAVAGASSATLQLSGSATGTVGAAAITGQSAATLGLTGSGAGQILVRGASAGTVNLVATPAAPFVPDPTRILLIAAELRALAIAADARTLAIQAENRTARITR